VYHTCIALCFGSLSAFLCHTEVEHLGLTIVEKHRSRVPESVPEIPVEYNRSSIRVWRSISMIVKQVRDVNLCVFGYMVPLPNTTRLSVLTTTCRT
jgi:hypothetical protein